MNIQRIMQNMWRGFGLVFVTVGLASCIADDLTEGTCDAKPQEAGLYFSLQADGDMQPAVTRTPAVDALNENLVKTVDIFVFREDGTLNADGYVHADLDENDYVAVYKGTGWQDNFADNETYTVYALANYKGGDDLSQVADLDDLKEVRMTDTDIAYYQGMDGYIGEKTFLMDGSVEVQKRNFPTGSEPYELEVPVYRAAVKVEVTVNFSEEWAAKFNANELKAQVANYATVTTAIKDGYALTDDQRGYTSTPTGGDAKENFTPAFVCARGANGAVNGSTIRFYAFVNRWDDLATNETMLLIDLPGTLTENNQSQTFEHNFYKIPLISNAAEPVMERNTFYQVVATVDMLGTEEVDEPQPLQDVHFATAEWVSSTVPVGEGDTPSYLILSEYHKDIRNADGFDDLEFYSSSPLRSVTIATSQEIEAALQSGDITFDYPGSGNDSNIPGIYFVNKDSERQSVDPDDPNDDNTWQDGNNDDEVTPSYDRDVTGGKIYLTSTNPENVTKRYITLKVTNQDGLTKYVVVEQYPLEYIQPIAGYYSYRDDLDGGTYEEKGTAYGKGSTVYDNRSKNYFFVSKVYTNGEILGWYWSSRNSRQPTTADWNSYSWGGGSFDDNNMMYFVTITQTNSEYNIAHPLTTSSTAYGGQLVTVSSAENDELISPSFMLASQLGTVLTPDDWNDAQRHCAYYVETYRTADGQVHELTDWRLPTTEEVKIIAKYQNKTPDVMATVLSGRYYYVSYQQAGSNNHRGTYDLGNGSGYTAVRCIRDIKPTDAFLQNTNQ